MPRGYTVPITPELLDKLTNDYLSGMTVDAAAKVNSLGNRRARHLLLSAGVSIRVHGCQNARDEDAIRSHIKDSVTILNSGCWSWNGQIAWNGYARISYENKKQSAHRVSFRVFKGPIPAGKVIMHSCDNRKCVNPEHLHLGTQSENLEDMRAKGRGPHEKTGTWKKHDQAAIDKILSLREQGLSMPKIAKQTGIPSSTVYGILKRNQSITTNTDEGELPE